MSTLEELWNKGSLKPESYPQLIRMLQRERNAKAEVITKVALEIGRLRDQIRAMIEENKQERKRIESSKH